MQNNDSNIILYPLYNSLYIHISNSILALALHVPSHSISDKDFSNFWLSNLNKNIKSLFYLLSFEEKRWRDLISYLSVKLLLILEGRRSTKSVKAQILNVFVIRKLQSLTLPLAFLFMKIIKFAL